MSNSYTYATIILPLSSQAQAQLLFGTDGVPNTNIFDNGLSATGELPATHFIASGPFDNDQLNLLVNDITIEKKVYFGDDGFNAIAAEGLKQINVV